jgi:hypothetical protein
MNRTGIAIRIAVLMVLAVVALAPRAFTQATTENAAGPTGAQTSTQAGPKQGEQQIDSLSVHEQAIVEMAMEPSEIVCRKHIVLVWPKNLRPQWYEEAGVGSPQDMADWLETIYRFSAGWTRFDPNAYYAKNNGEYIRLAFVHNGHSDFIFSGLARPYIGLRDLKNPLAGSEDWFGWLTHELSHDFWHEHPEFKRVKGSWGEAMCDYERYSLLLNMGMPVAAKNQEQVLKNAPPDDKYRGGAWLFLKLQREERLDGPPALWSCLRGKDFSTLLGKPQWEK